MRTLVLGAGGFLGLNAVDALMATGQSPLCGHRPRSNTIPLRRRKVQTVVADLDDRDSLERAMAGCTTVVHAAGHYPRDSRDRTATLVRAHREMQAVLDACARAGVRRLVYVSSTATVAPRSDGRPSAEGDVFQTATGIGPYHDAKWMMEECALAERRFEVVIACPGACIGPWDLRMGTSALLVATALGLTPQHPDGPVALVDVRDVGRAIAKLTVMKTPPGRVLLASRMVRLHAFLCALAARYGAPAPLPPLSASAALAYADGEEARVAGTSARPELAREIVDLVVHGVAIDGRLGATLVDRWTALDDTLEAFDAWAARLGLVPSRLENPRCTTPPTSSTPSARSSLR